MRNDLRADLLDARQAATQRGVRITEFPFQDIGKFLDDERGVTERPAGQPPGAMFHAHIM